METTSTHLDDPIEITPEELQANRSSYTVIDVRNDYEYNNELGHIEGSRLATLGPAIDDIMKGADKNGKYVFVCRTGGRSDAGARIALDLGFTAYNLVGGMVAWNEAGLPVVREE